MNKRTDKPTGAADGIMIAVIAIMLIFAAVVGTTKAHAAGESMRLECGMTHPIITLRDENTNTGQPWMYINVLIPNQSTIRLGQANVGGNDPVEEYCTITQRYGDIHKGCVDDDNPGAPSYFSGNEDCADNYQVPTQQAYNDLCDGNNNSRVDPVLFGQLLEELNYVVSRLLRDDVRKDGAAAVEAAFSAMSDVRDYSVLGERYIKSAKNNAQAFAETYRGHLLAPNADWPSLLMQRPDTVPDSAVQAARTECKKGVYCGDTD